MKKFILLGLCLACGCATAPATGGAERYRVSTEREKPYYLTTDAHKVEDTCPKHDILRQFNCTKDLPDGYHCFDVYMVQGSPTNDQRYTLLEESLSREDVSAQPPCPKIEPTCEAFLRALNYNLEFSWFLVNFPSSSFSQCKETYDCKRIVCFFPPDAAAGQTQTRRLSCVYKRNQIFFVGAEVTCRRTAR